MAGQGLRTENLRRQRVYRGGSVGRVDGAQTRIGAGIASPTRPPPLARGGPASHRIRDHTLPGRPVSLHHRTRWKQRSSTDTMNALSEPNGKPQVLPPKSNALERL